ncbi:MAG: phosphoribosylanthranilate isomerase [Bacteroidota bacterium]
MFIKVCGINNLENFQFLENQEQISHIGFIFYEKSPRFCSIELPKANKIKKRVGVFVNESIEKINELNLKYQLDVLQFHGDESPEMCEKFKNEFEVIKVFQIDENFDFCLTSSYENKVKYFLFDTKTPNFGGSGKQFSWQLLQNYKGKTPFFLSGGINPISIQAIKEIKHPNFVGIDLNSGFEISPGLKDEKVLANFLNELK